MPDQLLRAEATGTILATSSQVGSRARRYRVVLIRAGWGSSGHYSEAVLRRDGAQAWPAGTAMYVNHPTITEQQELPERRVQDWASITTTDPVWDPAEGGLVAEVEVFEHWQDLLNPAFAQRIGLSIRATGAVEYGEADGREGALVTSIERGISVDWVTRAGAGGRVLQLIESARAAAPDFLDERGDMPVTPETVLDEAKESQVPIQMPHITLPEGVTPQQLAEQLAAAMGHPVTRPAVTLAEARSIGGWVESRIHSQFTMMADEMYGQGRLTRPERIALSSAIGDALSAFIATVEADQPQLYQRDLYDGPPEDENTSATAMSEARAIKLTQLAEASGMTAREIEQALCDTVKGAYGGKDIWVWVRDWTDQWVVWSWESDGDTALYQQAYTVSDGAVALTGEPVEVTAHTTYQPAPTQAAGPGTTPTNPDKMQEGSMPEITEEQLKQLTESTAAAAVAAVKAELDATRAELAETKADATKRLGDMEATLAETAATNRRLENDRAARAAVADALKTASLPEASHAAVTESACRALPVTAAGQLDGDAFTKLIEAAIEAKKSEIAAWQEATGVGQIRGLGESAATGTSGPAAAATTAALEEAYKARGLSADAARLAAAGRP